MDPTPSATVGYWNDPDATKAAFSDGWLDSGDVMRADADGYLFFCGRRKQIIVHDSSNIYPAGDRGRLARASQVSRSAGRGRNPRPAYTARTSART